MRAIFPIALAVAGAAMAGYVIVPSLAAHKKHAVLSTKGQASLDLLVSQLQRRFHQRNNVDFGFSRVVRHSNERVHRGPVMGEMYSPGRGDILSYDPTPVHSNGSRSIRGSAATIRLKDGHSVSPNDYKQKMFAENDTEREAIAGLDGATNGVAIYTAGMYDNQGQPRRLKGPAYLAQDVPTAPDSRRLAQYAARAWRTSSDAVDGPDGWALRAIPVVADDPVCTDCHNGGGVIPVTPDPRPKTNYQVGDRLGLILIAYRPHAAGG